MIHVNRLAGAVVVLLAAWATPALCQDNNGGASEQPTRVYVPYEKLADVFQKEGQGVFLPYAEFQKLWNEARGRPADVGAAPHPWLISAARYSGRVGSDLARLRMELTIDVLADGWVQVPVGLHNVAVTGVSFEDAPADAPRPLLRLVEHQTKAGLQVQYVLLTRGKGRRTLVVDFVRQLDTKPGLNVLGFGTPPASIATLELLIPEENMKVDVAPMLAATTTEAAEDGKKVTRLQAFLGNASSVQLSWKPKSQAAEQLEPVVIAEQAQHIHVDEALVGYDVTFTYDIRRRGIDKLTIQLPDEFRVTTVEGANIAKWDIARADGAQPTLNVQLFSPVKDTYVLTVRMERFLQESRAELKLAPIVTQQALRRSGTIGITHADLRSVELRDPKNLARVDVARLDANIRKLPVASAWRFITTDYAATLAIDTVEPRLTLLHRFSLSVLPDRLELSGTLNYNVQRAGVFQVSLNLPADPVDWKLTSVGPQNLVEDFKLSGAGKDRVLTVLLRKRMSGQFQLRLEAQADRAAPDAPVRFDFPLAREKDIQSYEGQLGIGLAESLQAELESHDQMWTGSTDTLRELIPHGLQPGFVLTFNALDRDKPVGATLNLKVKPSQVTAVVHRLVDIQPGSIADEAIIDYTVRYSPVDTFYVEAPLDWPEAEIKIEGADIREYRRLPQSAPPTTATADADSSEPVATYKVVLQSPVTGNYRLKVSYRRQFAPGTAEKATVVNVAPVLAAGDVAGQTGHIAIARADTLAVGQVTQTHLMPADPTSSTELPYGPHRERAALAFRYSQTPYALSMPVATHREAAVFTVIATNVLVEQILASDGQLKTRAVYQLKTSQGGRISFDLPEAAELYAVLVDGKEAIREIDPASKALVIRLPHSQGQTRHVAVELSYAQPDASAGKLSVATPAGDVPIQQTLWRVGVPRDNLIVGHSRDAVRINRYRSSHMMPDFDPDHEQRRLNFEGSRTITFIKQGAPGELCVWTARPEVFHLVLGGLTFLLGLVLLKFSGFARLVVAVIVALGVLAAQLFQPLLSRQMAIPMAVVGGLVLIMWMGQWLLVRLRGGAGRGPVPVAQAVPPAESPPSESTADDAQDSQQSDDTDTTEDKE